MDAEHQRLIQALKGIQYIVINTCHGGFGLSDAAVKYYNRLQGRKIYIQNENRCWADQKFWLVPKKQRVVFPDKDIWNTLDITERQRINDLFEQQTFDVTTICRDDPYLVETVRDLGSKASGRFADLKIVEVPAGVDWCIEEYDGKEWVAEVHRIWR